jgi:hypothetical protein
VIADPFILTTMEKKVSNTRYVLDHYAQARRKNIEELMTKPKKFQAYVFNSGGRGMHYSGQLAYSSIAITDGDEKVHVVERRNRVMKGSKGVLFIKGGNPTEGVTYHKKGRAASRLTVWGRHNINSILVTKVFNHLIDTVNPSAKELLNDKVIQKIATKGLIGSILAGKVTSTEEAMAYRVTYLLKRTCGLQKEDASALYLFYKHFRIRLEAETLLYNSLDPRAVVSLFHPISGDTTLKNRLVVDYDAYGRKLQEKAQLISTKIDWTGIGFNPELFLKRISRKEKGIKDIVHLWGGGPMLSRNTRSVSVGSLDDDLPF